MFRVDSPMFSTSRCKPLRKGTDKFCGFTVEEQPTFKQNKGSLGPGLHRCVDLSGVKSAPGHCELDLPGQGNREQHKNTFLMPPDAPCPLPQKHREHITKEASQSVLPQHQSHTRKSHTHESVTTPHQSHTAHTSTPRWVHRGHFSRKYSSCAAPVV